MSAHVARLLRQREWPSRPEHDEQQMNEQKDPKAVVTHAELKPLCNRLERIEQKLDTLYEVWMQAQGGAKFAKMLFFVIGPIIGAIWWLKDHIKW